MLYHFVGCLIKDQPPGNITALQISSRNASLVGLIPPGTYAYFLFDSYTAAENISPFNQSSTTFLGGVVYTKKMLEDRAKSSKELLRLNVVALPGTTVEKAMSAQALIHTPNNVWMPFFDGDILINIQK